MQTIALKLHSLLMLAGLTLSAFDTLSADEPLSMVAIQGTPIIDGKINDAWNQAPSIMIRRPVADKTSLPVEKASIARVRCLWDTHHLYLLAEVQDDKISTTNGAPWEQDSVEFYVDENGQRSTTYQSDDGQYRISATGQITYGTAGPSNNATSIVTTTPGGYLVETSIELQTVTARGSMQLGFEAQVNNDPGSGRRESLMKWNSTDDQSWRDTSGFGSLFLADKSTEEILAQHHSIDDDVKIAGRTSGTIPNPANAPTPVLTEVQRIPDWAADAIFYQIFPERFRNGDPSNDPTRESLEFVDIIPKTWHITPWTDQWYKQSDWEKQLGNDFYEDGVFHRRYGGDLQGVIDRLDYLVDLGVNAIYLNPVFYARSLHKYDGNSFHHIDPYFGPDPSGDLALMKTESADPKTWKWTQADQLFLTLVRKAHEKKLRIIIDGVFNHTGRDFFAFQDIVSKQKQSEYIDWYVVQGFDDPATQANEFKYQCWWGVDTLPEFANNAYGTDLHPKPKAYIMHATSRWMDPNGDGDPSDGIDGWRLDVANEVPNKFWQDWNVHVRKLNPDAYTVAEIWEDAANYLASCAFSATMNYHGFAYPGKGFLIDGRLPASKFAELLQTRMNGHTARVRYALQNLFDSHDTDRLASMVVNASRQRPYVNPDRFDYDIAERCSPRHFRDYDVAAPNPQQKQIIRLAALFQMTFAGAPMIYYGTEAGMDGADDPCDRMPMVWEDLNYEARTLGPFGKLESSYPIKFDSELFDYYRRLINVRRDHPSLRHGSVQYLATNDQAQTIAFSRSIEEETLIVCVNRGERDAQIDLMPKELAEDVSGRKATRLVPIITSNSDNLKTLEVSESEDLKLQIPALTAAVWRVEY